jgi:hypothetical protein
MSYSQPDRQVYNLGHHDFGAGGDSLAIAVPSGKRFARVANIHVAATETFTDTTTSGKIYLGTGSDTDKFVIFDLGTLADTDAMDLADDTDAVLTGYTEYIDTTVENITQIEVTFVAPTGGTPAGMGHVTVTLDWF